jgi:hypothetical protein
LHTEPGDLTLFSASPRAGRLAWIGQLPYAHSDLVADRLVGDLTEPAGQQVGEAHRFLNDLKGTWDFFGTYEAWVPLAKFAFDDGHTGAVDDLPDVVGALYNCLTTFVDVPHVGTVHAVASVYGKEEEPSDFELAYEGIAGPLVLRFRDGTLLTATVEPAEESMTPRDRWTAGTASWLVQQKLEAVASLAERANIVEALGASSGPIAEAIINLLGGLAKTEDPPRRLVGEALRWLGGKVDAFADEFARTAGKAAGVAAAGTGAYLVGRYVPGLAHAIREMRELVGD